MEQDPAVLIIIGITGDLAKRKLLPAILALHAAKVLPQDFHILGLSRREVTTSEVTAGLADPDGFLASTLSMKQLNYDDRAAYVDLGRHLNELPAPLNTAQRLFYLSVPPTATPGIVEHLGASGLATPTTKLLLEKPFGTDLASAEAYLKLVTTAFPQMHQVYYLDHYLAKAAAQAFIVMRGYNASWVHAWDAQSIERIDIMAAEQLTIEGRAGFYEQTGALGDLVQSHLLQLLALVLMEPLKPDDWSELPQRRLAALEQLTLAYEPGGTKLHALRGQYESYPEAAGRDDTTTETYVSLGLTSVDPRWKGVGMSITTGKALHTKATHITLSFRSTGGGEGAQLIIALDPQAEVIERLWVKRPGYHRTAELREMKLPLAGSDRLPEGYEQIFYDALASDHAVFTTPTEILTAWKLLAPLQAAWHDKTSDLISYPTGSTPEEVGIAR